jgi:hypothetical protein
VGIAYIKGYIQKTLSSTGLLDSKAPCGGMAERLTPKKVTSVYITGRLLKTGESLCPIAFSATLGWLILSAPQSCMPELLAAC